MVEGEGKAGEREPEIRQSEELTTPSVGKSNFVKIAHKINID